MGERGCIAVQAPDGGRVYLYTHWSGYKLAEIVRGAIARGRDRLNDAPYFARVVFCEMVPADDWMGSTGFGIQLYEPGDIGYPTIVIDCGKQTVDGVNVDEWLAQEHKQPA